MERIDVVARAAQRLRARLDVDSGPAPTRSADLIERACDRLRFTVTSDGAAPMLGGAYARLQLWFADLPEQGGQIWVRGDLDARERAFAIAHELGHFALHRGEAALHTPCDETQVDPTADAGALRIEQHRVEEYSPRVRRELEANAFAAELLAPRAQVRHLFAHRRDAGAGAIAALFGITPALAARRLLDAVLAPAPAATMLEAGDVPTVESGGAAEAQSRRQAVLDALDGSQRAAAAARAPALVVAGPGTGKTATLVGRVAHLVSALSVAPERVLALTFSNRAAGEMRDRLERAGLPGAQMPVMTIHAFAAELLRRYPSKVPCGPGDTPLHDDFRILDNADAFLLMEELLADLPLRFYRSLGNPTAHLRTLLEDFSHARDQLLSPEAYLALVAAMPPMPPVAAPAQDRADAPTRKSRHAAAHPPAGTFTPEQIEKARERALAYGVWDRALRQRGLLDFGGLIQRAVELLRADAQVLAEVRASFPHVLVDEFQDTNRAAGELLLLVAGERGVGLWVVGDRNQSIYRWRGASPGNVARLREQYPALAEYSLGVCYRSVPAIVALGSALAARMRAVGAAKTGAAEGAGLADTPQPGALRAARPPGAAAVVRGERFATAAQEYAGLGVEIARQCAAARGYGDQAILCRAHRQTAHIAAALAAQGVPVALSGDFFERPEIKDALALVALAAGPDARGLLRAGALLLGLGRTLDDPRQLALAARGLAGARQALPGALTTAALEGVGGVSPATRDALAVLGALAQGLRRGPSVGGGLADYLLRPGGYAWRLVRAADRLDARGAGELAVCWSTGVEPHGLAVAEAQTALTALGELVRLALRFDGRWAREPDFRARLSRAITHRRTSGTGQASRPHAADTLEAVAGAGADVAEPMAEAASSAAAVETAPAVSCLLHYLGALRAADAAIALPAGTSDAVQVMTLHASKGLEFPIVYLPGLAEGQFPNTHPPREEVCPPGLREDDAPGEREAEERCLFYVGLTRARDRVVLTRAASYGARRASNPRGPSPLLALLDDAPEWQRAQPLFDDETLALLPVVDVAAPEEADEQDAEDEPTATAASPADATPLPGRDAARTRYDLSDLELYLECPRRYKYATRYCLLDPADNAVRRFHGYVRSGGRVLRAVRAAAPQADWEAAEARLRAHWEAEGPAGHAYDAFYWRHAQAILRRQWDTLCGAADASTATTVAEPLVAQLRGCRVATLVDRVEGAALPRATPVGTPVVLVRQHTGRPKKEHADQLCVSLYYLGYRQQHPHAAVRIELAYAGDALASERPEDAETRSGENVDVTEQARKVAERYAQPERAVRSKLDKLDDAAAGIAAGRFEPHPDERRCAMCPYRIVCPADPDDTGMAALARI